MDPYFGSILLLAPFSDSGGGAANIKDYGPQGIVPTFTGAGGMTVTQDNTVPLFGLNTLHVERTTAQNVVLMNFILNSHRLNPALPYCIEFWYNIIGKASVHTMNPIMCDLASQSSPGVYNGNLVQFAGTGNANTRATCTPGALFDYTVPLNQWNYYAFQYVPGATPTTYATHNASFGAFALPWDLPTNPPALDGIRMRGLAGVSGVGTRSYNIRTAQLRVTAANRYGTSAAPIPTGPWPLA